MPNPRNVIEEIDALIAQEQTETDLVATMLAEIDGVTYRLELRGDVASLYVPVTPVEWTPLLTESHDSVETFTGPYAFNDAAAKLIVSAMPKYDPEEGIPPLKNAVIATDSDAL